MEGSCRLVLWVGRKGVGSWDAVTAETGYRVENGRFDHPVKEGESLKERMEKEAAKEEVGSSITCQLLSVKGELIYFAGVLLLLLLFLHYYVTKSWTQLCMEFLPITYISTFILIIIATTSD